MDNYWFCSLLINKIPSGIYKSSREAILTAELPMTFTTRTNWKGFYPRDVLCSFCRQHRLSEPVFSILSIPLRQSLEVSESCKRLKVAESSDEEKEKKNGVAVAPHANETVEPGASFICGIKVFSKLQDLIIEFLPKDAYRKQNDAVQNSSLRVLLWLNTYFKELDMPFEKLATAAAVFNIHVYPEIFFKTFQLCPSIYNLFRRNETHREGLLDSNSTNPDSGTSPSYGSLACISYETFLVAEGEHIKEPLESKDEFEFEIGVGAVIPHLEAVVTQMSVGQSACFNVDLPPQELLLAAAGGSLNIISLLSSSELYSFLDFILCRLV